MTQIYLDNAASTPLLPEVLSSMITYLKAVGNPSSTHQHGQLLRVGIERARKEIAAVLDASPNELFFTSGATEANNWAIQSAVSGLGAQEVISSELEHASVREVLQQLAKAGVIKLTLLPYDSLGQLDMQALLRLVKGARRPTLLCFMQANNEIGNLLDMEPFKELQEGVYFHSDMVQSIGRIEAKLGQLPVHMASVSAHKFHGPKGVGLLYVRQGCGPHPLLYGGSQERGMRAGTENVAAIVGMAKALQLTIKNLQTTRSHILRLKKRLIEKLQAQLPDLGFNGCSADLSNSLPSILSLSLPPRLSQDTLLMLLDVEKVSVSVGSACTSGAFSPSHTLAALATEEERSSLRVSFSHLNTEADVDRCAEVITQAMRK